MASAVDSERAIREHVRACEACRIDRESCASYIALHRVHGERMRWIKLT